MATVVAELGRRQKSYNFIVAYYPDIEDFDLLCIETAKGRTLSPKRQKIVWNALDKQCRAERKGFDADDYIFQNMED